MLTAFAFAFQTATDCPQLKQELLGMVTVCLIHGQVFTSSRKSGQRVWQAFETCVLGESPAPIQEIKAKKGALLIKLTGEPHSEDNS